MILMVGSARTIWLWQSPWVSDPPLGPWSFLCKKHPCRVVFVSYSLCRLPSPGANKDKIKFSLRMIYRQQGHVLS
jgi:hypothetical protein